MKIRSRVADTADFGSFEDFYSSDETRRGDDVSLGEVADEALRWQISWLPRTCEVIGIPVGWCNDTSVPIVGGSGLGGVSAFSYGEPAVPEVLVLLGRIHTEEEARRRVSAAKSLEEIRAMACED